MKKTSLASVLLTGLATFAGASLARPTAAHASGWVKYPVAGCVTDLATVGNTSYAVGCPTQADPLGYRGLFVSVGHGPWTPVGVDARRVAASDVGGLHVSIIDKNGHTFAARFSGSTIVGFTEYANDNVIATSIAQWDEYINVPPSYPRTQGAWITGGTRGQHGFPIWHRENGATSWSSVPGEALQIAVDPTGATAFVVNDLHDVYKWTPASHSFTYLVEACVSTVAVASALSGDDVWGIGCIDDQPYEYTTASGVFQRRVLPSGVFAERIAAGGGFGSSREVLISDSANNVWYYVP